MKYLIGKIEGELPHKFVVSQEENNLVFHATQQFIREPKFKETRHKDIANKFGLRKILGGGVCKSYKDSTLEVGNSSSDYSAVPKEVLNRFKDKLMNAYKDLIPSLTNIEFDPYENEVYSATWKGIL
jgi:hypothetical protein